MPGQCVQTYPAEARFHVAQEVSIVSGMAGRYALALFELAKEQKSLDKVAGDLKSFADLVAASPDLERLVRSPVFSAEDQVKALGAVLAKIGVSGIAGNFLKLVASKRRLFAVQDMIRDFGKLVDRERGVTRAQVTVAEPLSDSQLSALKDALAGVSGGKTVNVDVKIDPAIIGGLVVKLGSRMVDGSLKTKLNSIRTRMKEVG
ncbi:MAG: F0F1 ATP synthase subunit delta [Rhizobiales bacterium]|nr:F0F1 ATP synthase subunit delta [Hyphomicrobiales bacterium]